MSLDCNHKGYANTLVYQNGPHIYLSELRRNSDRKTAICILGNKADLAEDREVDTEVAKNYAASINASHFETSAATGKGFYTS